MKRPAAPSPRLYTIWPYPRHRYEDRPIDVQIRIRPKETRYEAEILSRWGSYHNVSIDMKHDDLASLNRRLQEKMYTVAIRHAVDTGLTPAESREQLHSLAAEGNLAFKRFLRDRDDRDHIREILAALEAVWGSRGQKAIVQFTSREFFLPWELIYPDTPEPSKVSYSRFWGSRYIIYRLIAQERTGTDPRILTRCPRLGLLTYCDLSGVEKKERLFFSRLHRDGRIRLFPMRPLNNDKRAEELRFFKRFWNTDFDIAHFACHAFYEDEQPDDSSILLSNEFPISLKDIDVYLDDDTAGEPFSLKSHPLIVMNACETGNVNPLYTSSFAAAFLKYGARGVVATDCAVPDAFAADFGGQLYTNLLEGKTLGKSLLDTRQHFWNNYHNPSGLLYSMYASPSTRFVPPGG